MSQSRLEQNTYKLPDPILHVLQTKTARDVCVPPENLATVCSKDKLKRALEILIDNRVVGAPVLDPEGNIYGFIDVIDIAAAFQNKYQIKSSVAQVLGTVQYSAFLAEMECGAAANLAGRNTGPSLPFNSTILRLIAHFALTKSRHALISDKKGRLYSMVSQTQVLRYLYEQHLLFGLGDIAKQSISDLQIGNPHVVSIGTEDLTLLAFTRMVQYDRSGIGVLAQTPGIGTGTRLVGNISASDLKEFGYNGEFFDLLFLSAGDFLAQKKTYQPGNVTFSPADSFEALLYKFVAHKARRIYLVRESDQELLGIVTISDIFSLFCS